MFFRKKRPRCGDPSRDGQRFAFDDPRVPPGIRDAVQFMAQPDWELYFADTDNGGEWWLIDDRGELVEAFWQE